MAYFKLSDPHSYLGDKRINPKFGFIVIDGNGVLFGTLQDKSQKVLLQFDAEMLKKQNPNCKLSCEDKSQKALLQFDAEMPKKQYPKCKLSREDKSQKELLQFDEEMPKKQNPNCKLSREDAQRLTRLKLELRRQFIEKVATSATKHFITGNRPNVTNLILAGSGSIKTELSKSSLFDTRLKNGIKFIDVSSGGRTGFSEAIKRVAVPLKNIETSQEKNLVQAFLDEINQDSGKYCIGVIDTMRTLQMGAVKMVICLQELDFQRYVLENPSTGKETILYLTPNQALDPSFLKDEESGAELKIIERNSVIQWLDDNHDNYGATLTVLTKKCRESYAHIRRYGGICCLLRYKVDFLSWNTSYGFA